MSFCILIWPPSWIKSISFSTHSSRKNRHRLADLGYLLEGRIGGWRERRGPRTGRTGPGRAPPGRLQQQIQTSIYKTSSDFEYGMWFQIRGSGSKWAKIMKNEKKLPTKEKNCRFEMLEVLLMASPVAWPSFKEA
jgi:hypothetical protein